MKLEYNILWFEDNSEWCSPLIFDLQEYIENDLGFKFNDPNILTDTSQIANDNFYHKYDIIFMDLDLSETEGSNKGHDIIDKIRNLEVYTDIIFYSQSGEKKLRELVSSKELDGVYCVNREFFLDKAKKIIRSTIKKVLDLNNIRGLVLSSVADMDSLKQTIISQYCNGLEENKKIKFLKKRKKRLIESINKTLSKIKKMTEEAVLAEYEFSSYHKLMAVESILKELKNKEGCSTLKDCISTYQDDIINNRNILAHVKEDINEETGDIILKSNGEILDDEYFITLRKNITKHEENLLEIKRLIGSSQNI